MIKVTALRLQNIFFFFPSSVQNDVKSFPSKALRIISGLAEDPVPRGDLRWPGPGAMQSQGLALPQPEPTVPAGCGHPRLQAGFHPPSQDPEMDSLQFSRTPPSPWTLPTGKVPGGQGRAHWRQSSCSAPAPQPER